MLAPAFQPLFLLKFVSSNPPGQAFDLETDMSNVHLLACLCCNLHNWNQSLSYNECRWFFWKINVVNKINFLYNNNWFVVIYYDLSRHMSSILQLRSSRESSRLAYSFSPVKGSQPQLRPLVTCSELICWDISNYNVSKYCKLWIFILTCSCRATIAVSIPPSSATSLSMTVIFKLSKDRN